MAKPLQNPSAYNPSPQRESRDREEVLHEIKLALVTSGGLSLERGSGGFDPYNSKASRDVWGKKRRSN